MQFATGELLGYAQDKITKYTKADIREWQVAESAYSVAVDSGAIEETRSPGERCARIDAFRPSQWLGRIRSKVREEAVNTVAENPQVLEQMLKGAVKSASSAVSSGLGALKGVVKGTSKKKADEEEEGEEETGKGLKGALVSGFGTAKEKVASGLSSATSAMKGLVPKKREDEIGTYDDLARRRRYLQKRVKGREPETIDMLNKYGHKLSNVPETKRRKFKNQLGTYRALRTRRNGLPNLSPQDIERMNVSDPLYGMYPGQFHLPLKQYYALMAEEVPSTENVGYEEEDGNGGGASSSSSSSTGYRKGGKRQTRRRKLRKSKKTRKHAY